MASKSAKSHSRKPLHSRPAGASEAPPPVEVRYQESSGVDHVLRPTLVVVNGRCYRKNVDCSFGRVGASGREGEPPRSSGKEERRQPPLFLDDEYDEGEEPEWAELDGVEDLPGGVGYSLRVATPSVFFKRIIGREGRTKANIERDTKCRIRIPPRGKEGDIVVEAQSKSALLDAKKRLDVVTWSNRLKEPATHFISIPLPTLADSFVSFRTSVLASCSKSRGVCPEVFQAPEKLHLTLGVMRLFSKEEEDRAVVTLKQSIQKAIGHLGSEPAVLSLRGVECMNDDPSKVDVLYAKVSLTDGSDRLQRFVDAVVNHFISVAGDLMQREFEREGVKLHATLMNSSFLLPSSSSSSHFSFGGGRGGRGGGGGGREREGKRESFDASAIFKGFAEAVFGEAPLSLLHLSRRGHFDASSGYYSCVHEFPLSPPAPRTTSPDSGPLESKQRRPSC